MFLQRIGSFSAILNNSEKREEKKKIGKEGKDEEFYVVSFTSFVSIRYERHAKGRKRERRVGIYSS